MRKPIEDRILTIPAPTKDKIFEKYKKCFHSIDLCLKNREYNETTKLCFISYMTQIALDNNTNFKGFEVEIKNAGDTVHVDAGFWNKKGEYVEDIQEIDLDKE